MKILQVCLFAIFAVFVGITLIVLGNRLAEWISSGPRIVRIDCSIAEISPDIPVDAKEQCRRLRMEKFNGNK